MNYLVLFSVILIAASIVVLLLPSNDEGFENKPQNKNQNANSSLIRGVHPVAAGQQNSSNTAGAADGSSDNEHLLNHVLKKHDRMAEGFENRDANAKENAVAVSATTTQKKAIASTSADVNELGPFDTTKKEKPNCSTCTLDVNPNTNCVLPTCYSSSDQGYKTFPDNGYNFEKGCIYYDPDPSNPGKILPGMEGREPGYYCPPITQGQSYKTPGKSGDVCYAKQEQTDLNSYVVDYAKFVKIEQACVNDKQSADQSAGADDQSVDITRGKNTKHNPVSPPNANESTIHHQHSHSGIVNVYHHHMYASNKNTNNNNGKKNDNNTHKRTNNAAQSNSNSYMEPEPGATVLGFL